MGRLLGLVLLVALTAALVLALMGRLGGLPPVGDLLDPADGLYRTARSAEAPGEARLAIPGLRGPVTVVRDGRGVPHIYAEHDLDAIAALGFVTAQDRLFQLDFLPRVASGRLASVFGPDLVASDRFLRRTGMDLGARRNAARVEEEGGLEAEILDAYARGVNAYLAGLDPADLPPEFRLLGHTPDPWTPLQSMRLLQYMAYDLSFGSDGADYADLHDWLGEGDYRRLYPRYASPFAPMVPETAGQPVPPLTQGTARPTGTEAPEPDVFAPPRPESGIGSNNWAVGPTRSTTGASVLADDMHLALSLPAVFYEVHLATPTVRVRGVTIPGAPLVVAGFNERVAWGYTNTGADQLDHYALTLDRSGTRYRYDGRWLDLEARPGAITAAGGEEVADTLWLSHWGPLVEKGDTSAVAIQWTAHGPSRTLLALWGFARAENLDAFEQALEHWDTPMQNVLAADASGIAIRSAGHLPIRRRGDGAGLLDGSTDEGEWMGHVPFDELPYSRDPERGFLFSANQPPAGDPYPHYLGHDWRAGFRSLRIEELLGEKPRHSPDDLARYQADVKVLQRDLVVPLLAGLPLSTEADRLRQMLEAWDGVATVDRPEPLVLDELLDALERLAWDEWEGRRTPADAMLFSLLRTDPGLPYFDVRATPERERGPDLLALAAEQAADTLAARYGSDPAGWRWGDHHRVVFQHITRSDALAPFSRGPVEYPGFQQTLSPASGRPTTHSAAWRMTVDLSTSPPTARGVLPGGPSGHPFSRFYDYNLPTYIAFKHFGLPMPPRPEDVEAPTSTLRLMPGR